MVPEENSNSRSKQPNDFGGQRSALFGALFSLAGRASFKDSLCSTEQRFQLQPVAEPRSLLRCFGTECEYQP